MELVKSWALTTYDISSTQTLSVSTSRTSFFWNCNVFFSIMLFLWNSRFFRGSWGWWHLHFMTLETWTWSCCTGCPIFVHKRALLPRKKWNVNIPYLREAAIQFFSHSWKFCNHETYVFRNLPMLKIFIISAVDRVYQIPPPIFFSLP